MILEVYTDGGARGNPGPAAIGGLAFLENKKIFEFSKQIGPSTNNIAEYTALLEAIRRVKDYLQNSEKKINKIIFYSDSNLMVSQLNGLYKIKNANLALILQRIKDVQNRLRQDVSYEHIPREKNKEADRLVNESFDRKV